MLCWKISLLESNVFLRLLLPDLSRSVLAHLWTKWWSVRIAGCLSVVGVCKLEMPFLIQLKWNFFNSCQSSWIINQIGPVLAVTVLVLVFVAIVMLVTPWRIHFFHQSWSCEQNVLYNMTNYCPNLILSPIISEYMISSVWVSKQCNGCIVIVCTVGASSFHIVIHIFEESSDLIICKKMAPSSLFDLNTVCHKFFSVWAI